MAKKSGGVSFRSADNIETGLWQGGKAKIIGAQFCEYDYGGSVKKAVPVMLLEYQHAEGTYEQPYSLGSQPWEIVDEDGNTVTVDGVRIIPKAGQTGLPKNCNAAAFFKSLEDASEDSDLAPDFDDLQKDIRGLIDLGVNVIRKEQEARNFKDRKKDGGDEKKTFVLIDELIEAPEFEDKPKEKAKGSAAKGKAKPKADDDEEDEDEAPKPKKGKGPSVEDEAGDAIRDVLAKAPKKTLKITDLEEKVYAHLKGHPKRDDVSEWASNIDNLGDVEGVEVDTKKKTVTLAEGDEDED